MNHLFVSRPLLKTGIMGLLLLPFLILINHFSPPEEKIPTGYTSTILAFEFASNTEELTEVLQPLSAQEIQDLDRLNYVDFGFMVLYGIFLFLFISRTSQLLPDDWLKIVRWFIPVAVLSDALENVQLLKLTNLPIEDNTHLADQLHLLAIFTWSKWLMLAFILSILGYRLLVRHQSRLLGIYLFVPLVLGLQAFFLNSRRVEELFATSVFASFFFLICYSFLFRNKSKISSH